MIWSSWRSERPRRSALVGFVSPSCTWPWYIICLGSLSTLCKTGAIDAALRRLKLSRENTSPLLILGSLNTDAQASSFHQAWNKPRMSDGYFSTRLVYFSYRTLISIPLMCPIECASFEASQQGDCIILVVKNFLNFELSSTPATLSC